MEQTPIKGWDEFSQEERDLFLVLRAALLALDAKLTGKPERDLEHTAHNHWQMNSGMDFCFSAREYYLSDGGYSRVYWPWNNNGLRLSSNSRQQVKDLWEAAESERDAVGEAVRFWWEHEESKSPL